MDENSKKSSGFTVMMRYHRKEVRTRLDVMGCSTRSSFPQDIGLFTTLETGDEMGKRS